MEADTNDDVQVVLQEEQEGSMYNILQNTSFEHFQGKK